MLELRGTAPGLLDDPLLLEVGGAAPGSRLVWRTRIRDDDGFVWRAEGAAPDALTWSSKADGVAALRSLRPVELEVRVEGSDGTATRTLTRTVLDPTAKARRWTGAIRGRLLLPARRAATSATLLIHGEGDAILPTAALLASRGVAALVIDQGDPDAALDALAALPQPAKSRGTRTLAADAVPLPPGLPARVAADAAAWDALLADLGATPRRVAR